MIQAGIVGSTGYAGLELVRLLVGHREVEIKRYCYKSYIDQKYYDIVENMFERVDDNCVDDKIEELAKTVLNQLKYFDSFPCINTSCQSKNSLPL